MTGENPPGADRSVRNTPQDDLEDGVEYEYVDGELMPRGSRPWDPMLDLR